MRRLRAILCLIIFIEFNIAIADPLSPLVALLNAGGACHPLDLSWAPNSGNIVGLWHLDEASGSSSVVDSGPTGYTGTSVNSVSFDNVGRIGKAAVFNGTNNYIDFGAATAISFGFPDTTFSVSFWFKTTTANAFMVAKSAYGGGWGISMNANILQITYKNSANFQGIFQYSSATVNDGKWHHILAVITTSTTVPAGNQAKMYVDGRLKSASTTTTPVVYSPSTDKNLSFGARSIPTIPLSYYDGSLDEVAIWNTSLNAKQVRTIYDGQSCGIN